MGQCLWWCCHHDTSHCESSPGSSDECRPAPVADSRRPSDQANRSELRVRLQAAIWPTYIIVIYYYSAQKLILILLSHGTWNADKYSCM